jgi:hypothetical protein
MIMAYRILEKQRISTNSKKNYGNCKQSAEKQRMMTAMTTKLKK